MYEENEPPPPKEIVLDSCPIVVPPRLTLNKKPTPRDVSIVPLALNLNFLPIPNSGL